ncbi:MAG: ParA family protein [Oscillospiraceae bacterium]|nr:ParA family protein [Oscillospiraceae bacterium]
MGKIISVVNQKGGVGKTTTAVNLVASLGALGCKVLLIDIDPQGNATSGIGINKRTVRHSAYNLIIGEARFEDTLMSTAYQNLSIIPSHIDLAGAEIELVPIDRREYKLRDAIMTHKSEFDYIFIDCPPSLGLLTLNGLTACDTILIPIQCEYYALEGLSQLMSTVRQVKRLYNPRIELEGVLITMFDSRLNLTVQVADEVKKHFPKKVYSTAIPRNVRISEAPSYGRPVRYYDSGSKGSNAYDDLAKEIIEQNKRAEAD